MWGHCSRFYGNSLTYSKEAKQTYLKPPCSCFSSRGLTLLSDIRTKQHVSLIYNVPTKFLNQDQGWRIDINCYVIRWCYIHVYGVDIFSVCHYGVSSGYSNFPLLSKNILRLIWVAKSPVGVHMWVNGVWVCSAMGWHPILGCFLPCTHRPQTRHSPEEDKQIQKMHGCSKETLFYTDTTYCQPGASFLHFQLRHEKHLDYMQYIWLCHKNMLMYLCPIHIY